MNHLRNQEDFDSPPHDPLHDDMEGGNDQVS
jgi:hypothetical protein